MSSALVACCVNALFAAHEVRYHGVQLGHLRISVEIRKGGPWRGTFCLPLCFFVSLQRAQPRKRGNSSASDGTWFARGARDWVRLFRENGVSLFVHNACHNAWQMVATFSILLGLGVKIEIVESFPPRARA